MWGPPRWTGTGASISAKGVGWVFGQCGEERASGRTYTVYRYLQGRDTNVRVRLSIEVHRERIEDKRQKLQLRKSCSEPNLSQSQRCPSFKQRVGFNEFMGSLLTQYLCSVISWFLIVWKKINLIWYVNIRHILQMLRCSPKVLHIFSRFFRNVNVRSDHSTLEIALILRAEWQYICIYPFFFSVTTTC